MTMKPISVEYVKIDKDKKRNSKKRYLVTDGICFKCGAIVNYEWEKACILCCGSEDFLVGEYGKVLRELLELHIEQLKTICEIRKLSIGSRPKMVFELFKMIFPKLVRIDERINDDLIRKIIIRNRRKFWYIADIEDEMYKIKINRDSNLSNSLERYNLKYLKPVNAEDVVEIDGVKVR